MKVVTIKPSPLSKRFTSVVDGMKKVTSVTENGSQVERSLGSYKQERLPNSSQMERPVSYSYTKRRWMLKDHSVNSEEL